jgi:hypothetical protein
MADTLPFRSLRGARSLAGYCRSFRHQPFTDGSENASERAIAIDNRRLFDATLREIAERRRAEAALRELNAHLENRDQATLDRFGSELASFAPGAEIGQLTGGIAVNNLLQIIIGNLETLSRNLPIEMARLRRADS